MNTLFLQSFRVLTPPPWPCSRFYFCVDNARPTCYVIPTILFHSPAPPKFLSAMYSSLSTRLIHHWRAKQSQWANHLIFNSFRQFITLYKLRTKQVNSTKENIMTPKQKSQHITNIRAIFDENGLTKDRWGNYRLRSKGTNYRIKIMSNNCRCERKAAGRDGRWLTVWSIPHRAVRTRPIGQLDQFSSSR